MTKIEKYLIQSKCLSLQAGQHLRGMDVVHTVELLAAQRGLPERIQVDNGPESQQTIRLLNLSTVV